MKKNIKLGIAVIKSIFKLKMNYNQEIKQKIRIHQPLHLRPKCTPAPSVGFFRD